jgi:oligopeptide/dipeptide ABC transporter ATP-binding protein
VALLDVRDLHVSLATADGTVHAVRGLSFSVDAGETMAIVGESGSGKSMSMLAILGLAPTAQVTGAALLDGRDLLAMDEDARRQVRGAEVGMVFQDPFTALHPCRRVGWQIVEAIRAHDARVPKRAAKATAKELLALVGVAEPDRRLEEYPHQLSGGMRQRVVIAMAMARTPKLLIADEPTSALDAGVQAQVLEVLAELQSRFGTALVFITHDLRLVAEMADRVLVMYAGTAMEVGRATEVVALHRHPYTAGLFAALPNVAVGRGRLTPIDGTPPSLIDVPPGCPFHPRCRHALRACATDAPPMMLVDGEGHRAACWLASEQQSPPTRTEDATRFTAR